MKSAACTVITRQIPACCQPGPYGTALTVALDISAAAQRRHDNESQFAVASNSQNNYRLDATCAVRLATLSALQRGQRDERVVAHSPPWGTALSMPAAPQVRRLLWHHVTQTPAG